MIFKSPGFVVCLDFRKDYFDWYKMSYSEDDVIMVCVVILNANEVIFTKPLVKPSIDKTKRCH